MQAAVYAVRTRRAWRVEVSLDAKVDLWWWLGVKHGRNDVFGEMDHEDKGDLLADKLVLLARALPLGWAVAVREGYEEIREMDHWRAKEWRRYLSSALAPCLAGEPEDRRRAWLEQMGEVTVLTPENLRGAAELEAAYPWRRLYEAALHMGGLMEGRALLAGEVEGLLETAGADLSAGWLAAAQLGCLVGRLRFTAGLAPPAPRGTPGRLRRRRALPCRCRRCGSEALGRTACAACGSAACAYCEACLAMGRSRACALLLQGAAQPAVRGTAGGSPTAALGRWGLSAAQGAAAGAALRFLAEPAAAGSAAARFLIWAVTGAGKTEMIFPLLQSVLEAGGRVLVSAPRKDVVLELSPRLAAAFPSETIVTLYGGSPDRWKRGTITLATTHQLLRFKNAFDLVVIDEIDAFPYHNDPMLDFAAKGACKPGGKYIYLSATPPSKLQREAASGRLPHAKVPARFHGYPLPVPKPVKMLSVKQCLTRKSLPSSLVRELRCSLERGAQVFLFVSRIRHIEPFLKLLCRHIPGISIEGTSSVDPERADKVLAFRKREIRLLVTTTILERGVTVPMSDVFIVDADSELFDEAALIQMAGRAGRSKDDPAGKVVFAAPQWTRSQRSAINQIKRMNRIAAKGGYLKV